MRVTVFGVDNPVGRAVVDHLFCRGCEVQAFVVDPRSAEDRWGRDVQVTVGDVTDPVAVAAAVAGSEAVINALDPRLDRPTADGALVRATTHIVAAMEARGVRRYIGLGGPVTGISPTERPSAWLRMDRAVMAALHPRRYRQKKQMLAVVTGADLDWTIVRFVHRAPGAAHGVGYVGRFGHDDVGMWTTAADIAGFAAAQVLEHRFIGAAPAISH